jgi:hypothetical protein
MRFTIPDLLWLTTLVAVAIVWRLQYSRLTELIKANQVQLAYDEFKIRMSKTLFANLANRFKEVAPDEITIFENGAVQVKTKSGTGLWLHLEDAVGEKSEFSP